MIDLQVGTLFYDHYNFEHEIRAIVDECVYVYRYKSPKSGNLIYEVAYSYQFNEDPSRAEFTLEPRERPLKWGY